MSMTVSFIQLTSCLVNKIVNSMQIQVLNPSELQSSQGLVLIVVAYGHVGGVDIDVSGAVSELSVQSAEDH